VVPSTPVEKPVSAPAPADAEPATCKELVERLQKRGLDVVWFGASGVNGPPAIVLWYKDENKEGGYDWKRGNAKIIQYPTPAAAREMAGAIPGGFAYGRFVIAAGERMAVSRERQQADPQLFVEDIKDCLR
jgi:hypothetical protein